jgi:putative restriction endonuclease
VADLADYLDLTVSQARQQFRELKLRNPVSSGRQAVFLPVETLLCLAVSFLVNHRRFGGSTAHLAPEPIPSLARLFSRPPSSILAKMANLDGSRSHGGKWDILAGAVLRDEPAHFTHIYRTLLTAARAQGIGAGRLPDFLGLEHDGEFDLLGQDELGPSALENAFKDQIAKAASCRRPDAAGGHLPQRQPRAQRAVRRHHWIRDERQQPVLELRLIPVRGPRQDRHLR